ncbi:MAG: M28 family peptidase [Candidatus Thorarchaeota archaeon]|nr:MAG: M28 family peptidase [Candidatus Thorarchaeota archaeon]
MIIENTSIDEIRKTVEDLCAFGQKVAGTENEVRAANYIYERLIDFGFSEVEKQPFEVHGWDPISCTVRVTEPIEKDIEAALFPYCKSESVQRPLAILGQEDGPKSAMGNGMIALSEWGEYLYFGPRFAYYRALALGYEGLIVGSQHEGDLLKVVVIPRYLEIPVVCVTKEESDSLRAMIEEGPVVASIETQVEVTSVAQSFNVVATLEGDGTHEHEIVIGAHYDSWFQGAADNCAPAASVLELARVFQAYMEAGGRLKRTVKFIFYGAEESGSNNFHFWINGSRAYVRNNQESVSRTAAVLNLDSTGYTSPARDHIYATADIFEFARSLEVSTVNTPPLSYLDPPSYGGDHWFFEISGVPTIFGGAWPSPLYHTQKDDPEHLYFQAVHFYAEYMKEALAFLTSTDLLPIDVFLPLKHFERILSKYEEMEGHGFNLRLGLERLSRIMARRSAVEAHLSSIMRELEAERVNEANRFLLRAANRFNRTIGWTTRPLDTYENVDYLSRLELIEDHVHLTKAIESLRNIPIATINSASVERIEQLSDNAYNWIYLHEPLAKLEEERARIRGEIEDELSSLFTDLDSLSSDISEMIDK